MEEEIWTWENCGEKIKSLSGRLGFPEAPYLKFLKLRLSLEDGSIHDELRNKPFKKVEPIYCILTGYANAKHIPEKGELISFSKLPGGGPYKSVFIERVAKPVESFFGSNPDMLYEITKIFNCSRLDYGDCSVKIYSLPLVPIVYILWGETSEFPASANVLFDATITNYLTTEQVVLLSELTTRRMIHAYRILREKN
ncbi:MAG: DUF3786 domain-containing protein [Thermoproteales archaeon]|nr:DUF3786 domain-containing protein [Thermoproteales archaeon]